MLPVGVEVDEVVGPPPLLEGLGTGGGGVGAFGVGCGG
jgi:hypothetical protein